MLLEKENGFKGQGPWPRQVSSSGATARSGRAVGAQWARTRPLLFVDIALGLLFFAVGQITGNLTPGRRQMRP